MEDKRNQGLDLLRIIAMWGVICIHYIGWGGVAQTNDDIGIFNFVFSGGLAVACNCAVNCFYLISGYFIGDGSGSKKRILRVWLPTIIYSISLPLILLITGQIELSAKEIIFLFLPVTTNQYWFSTCFVIMSALLPYIAKVLNSCSKKALLILLGILLFIDSIQPLFVNVFYNTGYGILHALTIFVIGYCIRAFNFRLRKIYSLIIFVACVGVICLIVYLTGKNGGQRSKTISDYNSPLMIIQSVAVFMFFMQLKVKFKFSKLAPYVFGVYLLNDNNYARSFLWHTVFRTQNYYTSALLPLHLIGVTVGFLVIGILIEYARINSWKFIVKKYKKRKTNQGSDK